MKKLIGGIVLIAIGVIAFLYGFKVQESNQQARKLLDIELAATPTPTADIRSMLQVTPDANATPGPTALLIKTGSKGDNVTKIQDRLRTLGYYTGSSDGQYGQATAEAVRRFQSQHGLTADGIVGEGTWAALFSQSAQTCAPTATPTPKASLLKKGDSGEEVSQMQKRLQELGYYSGEIDGSFGSGTEESVKRFQRQNGLDADGIAAEKTFSVLYSDSAATAAPVTTLDPDAIPILVNRSHPIDASYVPTGLVYLKDYIPSSLATVKGSEIQGEKTAVEALVLMLQAAQEDGLTNWQVNAGYRSYSYQKQLFDQSVSEFMEKGYSRSKAESATRLTVADPGASEHHTGLAFDITVKGASQFKGTDQQKWLHEHCWDYGFIIRYQEDKEDITGYIAECWHIRYVGVTHSQAMRDQNLCLEEYLGMTD